MRTRYREIERALAEFAKRVCEKEGVRPPNIRVVPEDILLQITDGVPAAASYGPLSETISIGRKHVNLYTFAHELHHHIDYCRRGPEHIREILETKALDWEQQPSERKARQFAIECMKYISDWKQLVEPVVGKGKILPSRR